MKIDNNKLKSVDLFDITQHKQEVQKTLYNTVAIKTTNNSIQNAQNFFNVVKKQHKIF